MLLTALSALVAVCTGCHTNSGTTQQPSSPAKTSLHPVVLETYDDPDAYEVYNLLLGGPRPDALIGKTEQGTPTLSRAPIEIESQTGGDTLCFDPVAQPDSRLRQAATDYDEQNSKPRLLKAGELRIGQKIELISRSDLNSIFADGIISGWKKFRDIHPNVQGYTRLSAVGFSPDKNVAVVFLGRYCGPTCGAGGIVTLSRKNGIWRRNWDDFCSWIS